MGVPQNCQLGHDQSWIYHWFLAPWHETERSMFPLPQTSVDSVVPLWDDHQHSLIISMNVFHHFPARPLDHMRDQRGTRRLAPQGVFRRKSSPSRRYLHKKKHISTWQQILALSPWCHQMHHPGSIPLSCRSGSDHSLEGLNEHGEFLTACSPKSYKPYMKMKMWNHVNMILSQRTHDHFHPSSSLIPPSFRWHLSDIDSRLADWKHTWPA